MKPLSDAPLVGRLLALPTNIRLGWQYLPETDTRHYAIVPNVTIPKLVKIPNINRNPAIPPPNLVPFPLT
jgi:hypothetical protein